MSNSASALVPTLEMEMRSINLCASCMQVNRGCMRRRDKFEHPSTSCPCSTRRFSSFSPFLFPGSLTSRLLVSGERCRHGTEKVFSFSPMLSRVYKTDVDRAPFAVPRIFITPIHTLLTHLFISTLKISLKNTSLDTQFHNAGFFFCSGHCAEPSWFCLPRTSRP